MQINVMVSLTELEDVQALERVIASVGVSAGEEDRDEAARRLRRLSSRQQVDLRGVRAARKVVEAQIAACRQQSDRDYWVAAMPAGGGVGVPFIGDPSTMVDALVSSREAQLSDALAALEVVDRALTAIVRAQDRAAVSC